MSKERITRRSPADQRSSPVDWSRFDALTDEDIEAAVRDDPDAAPIVDEAWFAKAHLVAPPPKEAISIRLDKDLLEWFREQGPGYQTRVNNVLRAFVEHARSLARKSGK